MIVRSHRISSLALLLACQGSIVPAIAPKLIAAAILGVIATLCRKGHFGDGVDVAFYYGFGIFTALGVAISLFLGFHNNASYQRWWEARTLWGTQIIHVRNLTRFLLCCCPPMPPDDDDNSKRNNDPPFVPQQSSSSQQQPSTSNDSSTSNTTNNSHVSIPIPLSSSFNNNNKNNNNNIANSILSPSSYDWRNHIIILAMAQTHALRAQLRPHCHSDKPLTALDDRNRFLAEKERLLISASRNPANAILHYAGTILSTASRKIPLDPYVTVEVSRHLDNLCIIQTACERIHNTSLPLAYSLLVHRTSFLYVTLVPFAIADTMGWWTPLFTVIVAYTFFGLDELARQIQEPFRDEPNALALSAMCRTIEVDVLESLGRVAPEGLRPVKAVLM